MFAKRCFYFLHSIINRLGIQIRQLIVSLNAVRTIKINRILRYCLREICLHNADSHLYHFLHARTIPCKEFRIGKIKAAYFGVARCRRIKPARLSLLIFYEIAFLCSFFKIL